MTVGQGEEIISLLKDIKARAMSIAVSLSMIVFLHVLLIVWLTWKL